jgi:hypothetical protein
MERQRIDGDWVQADRRPKGQRIGRLIVEHDAAGIGASGVRECSYRRLEPIGQIEVRGRGAVDPMEGRKPG